MEKDDVSHTFEVENPQPEAQPAAAPDPRSLLKKIAPGAAACCLISGLVLVGYLLLREPGCRTGCSSDYKLKGNNYVVQAEEPDKPQAAGSWTGKEAPPDVSKADVGLAGVKAWAKARTKLAAEEFTGERTPSPSDWSTSIIYNLQVDRFNNGDPSNDKANVRPFQKEAFENGEYKEDFRHGGDLEGLRVRLPYLHDMGVNVIWLTPVMQHDGAYHGYCTSDVTRIDDGFGTNELFRKLVAEAHQLDIRIVFDVVVNHLCRSSTDTETRMDPVRDMGDKNIAKCANDMDKKHWNGDSEETHLQTDMHFGHEFFPPFKDEMFFNRCGMNSEKTMGGNDPITVYGDFAIGMYDYNTRNREFQELFTELMKWWIAFADVDGYRMDAAKHVTEDFLAYFSTHIRTYAESIGKDNFFIIGEVAASDEWQSRRLGAMGSDLQDPNKHDYTLRVPKTVTKMLVNLKQEYLNHSNFKMPGMNSIYSFYSSGKAKAAFVGKDDNGNKAYVGQLGSYWRDDGHELSKVAGQLDDCCAEKPDGCTAALTTWWTLLEIHDWPRFLSTEPKEVGFGMMGFVWLFTAPGAPVVHYGAEQGFNGECPPTDKIKAGGGSAHISDLCRQVKANPMGHAAAYHPFFRQDMYTGAPLLLGSAVPAIDNMKEISLAKLQNVELHKGTWEDDPMLDRNHAMYKLTRKLAKLRKACPVLNFGQVRYIPRNGPPRSVLVYSRLYKKQEAVIVLNPSSSETSSYEIECDLMMHNEGDVFRNVLEKSSSKFDLHIDGGKKKCNLRVSGTSPKLGKFQALVLMKESVLKQSAGEVDYDPSYDDLAYCKPEDASLLQF